VFRCLLTGEPIIPTNRRLTNDQTNQQQVTWEAAYRAFTRAADCRLDQGQAESAEVLFYLGEASDKLGDRQRALDAFSRVTLGRSGCFRCYV